MATLYQKACSAWPWLFGEVAQIAQLLNDPINEAKESLVELIRLKGLTLTSCDVMATTSTEQPLHTEVRIDYMSLLHVFPLAARRVRTSMLRQEDGTDNMQADIESGTPEAPDDITTEAPVHKRASRQDEASIPESETGGSPSVPSDMTCPADPSQYSRCTPCTTEHSSQESPSQENALERRMNEIRADWARCQEDGSSDSESNNDLDIDARSSSASDASDDLRAEGGGTMCFTCHGDASPSGTPGSPATNKTNSANGSRTCKDGLLQRASQPLHELEGEDGFDSSEGLIANARPTRNEKASAKIIPCPVKDCSGKESSMSELLWVYIPLGSTLVVLMKGFAGENCRTHNIASSFAITAGAILRLTRRWVNTDYAKNTALWGDANQRIPKTFGTNTTVAPA
jgi:hypothetical protein